MSPPIAPATTDEINARPNPCNDMLTMEVPAGTTRLDVFAADGRVMLTQPVRDRVVRLAVEALAPGLYLVRATGSHGPVGQGRFVRR